MSLFVRPAARTKSSAGDAENPFWISYADLMTALMVLFLVALTVALFAVTRSVSEDIQQKTARREDIAEFMLRLEKLTREHPGISIRGPAIDFGERARFRSNSDQLEAAQVALLRRFVPEVLQLARDPLGARWLKRIAVVGYADARGSYLYNLDLSLRRSQRVLCALLVPVADIAPLAAVDRGQVRQLFIVSGASFNALKDSPEASRRIELRLEFFEPDEYPVNETGSGEEDRKCPLDR